MTSQTTPHAPEEQFDSLPFPYSQRPYCEYEPFEKRIKGIRVLVVNNLLRDETDLSEAARREWGDTAASKLERERYISGLALDNIVNNITRLVEEPEIKVAHLSEVVGAAREFEPEAVVLSGTLSDFDYYDPEMLRRFAAWAVKTTTPVLGICGGHQLIGLCFGVPCVTLDDRVPGEKREGRDYEYQYHYVRVIEPGDPIFRGVPARGEGGEPDYPTTGRMFRVWHNHGLQLARVPEGFRLLADSVRCRNQMMVKREDGQLIYTVQFHLEKSFQDLTRNLQRVNPNLTPEERRRLLREEASARTSWAHPVESRDGRLLFENFLMLALEHNRLAN